MNNTDLIAKAATWEKDWGSRRTGGLIDDLAAALGRADAALEETRAEHTEYERRLKRCLKPDALEGTALSPIELAQVRQGDYERLRRFAMNIRDGWDCDVDAHRRGTPCRCCEAEKLVGAAS